MTQHTASPRKEARWRPTVNIARRAGFFLAAVFYIPGDLHWDCAQGTALSLQV